MPDRKGNPKDNEGKLYVTQSARTWPKAPRPWFNPDAATYLACPRCSNTWVGVIVSDGPFIQLFCPQCGFAWGPMEMHKPQMTNSVAVRMGIPVAREAEFNTIESEMDIPNSELPDEN